ncbi:RNA 3'-terminal phosphate cyclase-like [Amphiura filiformis]|uniref:RNA 3'-terminal phosphate cyclase-like n=1 Tax=Amphiura filiformis TaxID=82378 RepID=UPI003B21A74C
MASGDTGIVLIDGGAMEGGGQILRMASALSALTCTPVKVNNIRAGRSNPGLRPQHLCGLQLVRDLSAGQLIGGQVSSTDITLKPATIKAGSYQADTKTAGSLGLLIQVSLPCLLYAPGPSQMTLKGGTNAEFAPQIDYTTTVFKPIAEKMGVQFECDIKRRGYFPKGGGEVRVTTTPVKHLKPIEMMDPGHVTKITGTAFVAGVLPIKMAQSMARTATDVLRRQYKDVNVRIDAIKEQQHAAVGNGSGIIVIAETSTGCLLAGSSLGKRGVQAEEVGRQAAQMLLDSLQHGGCVDEHLQDQLIIFMALASGVSKIRCGPITLHTETAIHVAKQLTEATFTIKSADDSSAPEAQIIECNGIGLQNKQL